MDYVYSHLTLERGRGARDLAKGLYGEAATVAVFAPMLGFPSTDALVLARAPGAADAAGVVAAAVHRLRPTARPVGDVEPKAGGVYVHNWFTIDAGKVDEFVTHSTVAWQDFETRFDALIYGLFAAEPTEADKAAGQERMLLMTRYRDLGEWQVSRDPTSEAMKSFARRRELTRVSLARSCVVLPRA